MRRDLVSIDDSARLVDQVQSAIARKQPLRIRGGNSKASLGRHVEGEEIDTRSHRGIVSYDPSELVITARAGTPLAELNAILDEAGQMLPCEPPTHGEAATTGGMVATGLSGPRRPWAGSVRDFVLGCRIVTGEGKHLRFGGQVMKNVAGYDVSRLMSGSFGCLGLITEVSLKVLPKPRETKSLTLELEASEAMRELASWRRAALPVSGACHFDGLLHVRLEGGPGSVHAAADRIGGEALDERFWISLRERRLPFFDGELPLWRLSLPNATPLIDLPGAIMLDWGGAQRWLKSDASADVIRAIASAAGGHATCFTPNGSIEPFHPLAAPLMRYHAQLKQRLDPHGVFNPGRMYADY
ncbi:glycolate oxidase subunit GlcE [Caballeronia insecticola]|uniref:FAD linked oxidase domain protein n=1 Tax=Caballeronia insecticola TaxID=758793 RepID=R4WT93_9BURK|nr:glycolate oxidase subunit GlcE [Caballeronia insecticola]BAN27769.1 FAD linked oxidase domain protein [Caballeronia insecticola]